MTEQQVTSTTPQQIKFDIEIIPENAHEADPALLSAVGRDTIDALRRDGYIVEQPEVYTGEKGVGEILFQVIVWLENIPTEVWMHRDVADLLSALCSIFGTIIPAAKHLLASYQHRTSRNYEHVSPIKISVEIDGAAISVEAPDLEQAETAMKLAQHFYDKHPTITQKVVHQNQVNVKLKANIPRNPPRKRR